MDRTVTKAPPNKVSGPQGKNGRWHVILMKLNRSKGLYLFLLPAVVYFLVFNYFPMYGVQIAFKDFSPVLGITGSPWIGFDHFERFFNSYYFTRLIRNTLCLSLYSLVVSFPIPVILALAFNEIRSERMKKAVQTISYAPHFISIVVMVGVLNLFFSQSSGLINKILVNLGMEKIPFLTSSSTFPHMYVWSGIWQNTGWNAIIYIAALSGVDTQLHEAAQVDGASRWQRVLHINLPSILPTVTIMFIMNAGKLMSMGFEKIFLMQNQQNIETSQVIATFVYQSGLLNADYGFAAAIGLFNNVINVVMLLIVNKISQKLSETSLF